MKFGGRGLLPGGVTTFSKMKYKKTGKCVQDVR